MYINSSFGFGCRRTVHGVPPQRQAVNVSGNYRNNQYYLMRKIINLNFLILFTTVLVSCSRHLNQAKVEPSIKIKLTEEILEMDKKDQLFRWQLLFGETDLALVDSLSKLPTAEKVKHIKKKGAPENKLTDRDYDEIQRMQDSIDQANRKRILQVYKTYGWPGKTLVGKAAPYVTIMSLHFPDSLMVALYPKLKKEYKRGNISGSAVAQMYDKHLLLNKQPLLYGMFQHYDSASKKNLPPMIKNITETNKARKKLGLPPLEKYRLNN